MRVAKKSREKIARDLLKLARPIDSLKVDPKNVRLHDRKSIEGIKFSLGKFGQQKAIVYDPKTGIVTAGNGTIVAARELGWKRIAASSYDGPGAARDYAVADNATQDLSRFDPDRLHVALRRFDLPALEALGLKSMAHVLLNPDDPNEPSFQPAAQEEQGKLDIVVQVECPNCGHKFRRR